MKLHQVEQKTPDWFELRKGKITGTGLKRIVGSKLVRDNYFYEVVADRLTVNDGNEESALDRGERLEPEAIEAYEQATGKIVDRVGFAESDENEFVGLSPDGLINSDGKYSGAIEVKCLSSANHIKAWIENQVPKDFWPQVIQYFIVNKDLETLDFVLYDPRVSVHPLHIITVHRKDIEKDIAEMEAQEAKFLEEVHSAISEIIKV